MVSKPTKNAIISIKKNIDMYGKDMAKLQEKITVIDEKYRKMAEEAKKDLTSAYVTLESEQAIWQHALEAYDADVVNEVLGEYAVSSTADDTLEDNTDTQAGEEETVVTTTQDEETVKDNLFPENNEPTLYEESKPEESGELPEREAPTDDDLPSENEGTDKNTSEKSVEEQQLDSLWSPEGETPISSDPAPEFDGAGFTESDNESPVDVEAEADKVQASDNNEWPDFPDAW